MTNNENAKKIHIIFVVGLLVILAYAVWKAFYGLGGKDEPYYYTIVFQMMKGDALFKEIWGFISMQSFFVYPLVKFAMLITGGKAALFLCLRLIYILILFLSGIFIYKRIKNISPASFIVVWFYLLFVPGCHSVISYNSLSYICGFTGVVLLFTMKSNKDVFICGILFGLCVLCQPLLFIEMIVVLIYVIAKKREIKRSILFLLGGALVGIPVMLYITIKIGISDFIRCIPWNLDLLKDTHTANGIVGTLKYLTWALFPQQKIFGVVNIRITSAIIIVLIVACFVINIIYWLNKKRVKAMFMNCMLVLCVLYSINCAIAFTQYTMTVCMAPWLLFGFVLYLASDHDRVKSLFRMTFTWTILHGISFMTSNGGMKSYSIAIYPTVLISIMLFYDIYWAKYEKKKIFTAALSISAVCMMIVGALAPLRTIGNAATVEKGACKNLSDTKQFVNSYNRASEDAEYINKRGLPTLILTDTSSMLLFYENEPAQTATMFDIIDKNVVKRQIKYYKLFPKKTAKGLYIREEDLDGISAKEVCEMLGFDINKSVKLKEGIYIERN